MEARSRRSQSRSWPTAIPQPQLPIQSQATRSRAASGSSSGEGDLLPDEEEEHMRRKQILPNLVNLWNRGYKDTALNVNVSSEVPRRAIESITNLGVSKQRTKLTNERPTTNSFETLTDITNLEVAPNIPQQRKTFSFTPGDDASDRLRSTGSPLTNSISAIELKDSPQTWETN